MHIKKKGYPLWKCIAASSAIYISAITIYFTITLQCYILLIHLFMFIIYVVGFGL